MKAERNMADIVDLPYHETKKDGHSTIVPKTSYLKNCSKFARQYLVQCFVLMLFCEVSCSCKFPRYLQNGGAWTATYKDDVTFRGYFDKEFLRAGKCNRHLPCDTYNRRCISKISDEKFEVQHMTDGSDHQYLCMQFIKRSPNVVQIKESVMLYFRDADACNDEKLRIDLWPLVSFPGFFKNKVPCPFIGGYNVRFHTSDSSPTCPKEMIPPRLESECETGDGISIDFRQRECMVENLEMDTQQDLQCLATWTHDQYTFVILRPQKADAEFKAWCLRIPGTENLDNIQEAHLFMDLVCDPGVSGQIRTTTNYLYLEFERRIVSSICANLSPICDDKRLCEHEISRNCPKTCKYCKGDPNPCTFLAQFQGHWVQYEDNKKKFVNISYYELTMSDAGRFQCHEQDDHDFENSTMLLQTFDNGCFPRLACLEINKPSASTLEYRLGNRVKWPVSTWNNLKATVCDDKMFRPNSRDMMRISKEITNKPTTILVDNQHHYPTFCQLDKKWFKDNQMYIKEIDHCDMCLVYDSVKHPMKIIQVPLNCSKDEHVHKQREFKCIAPYPQDDTTHAILTRTLHVHEEYQCWVFVQKDDVPGQRGVIYILEPAKCDKVGIEAVKNELLKPKKIYTIPKTSSNRSCPYHGQLISTSTTPDAYVTPRPYPMTSIIPIPAKNSSKANPVLVNPSCLINMFIVTILIILSS